MSRPFMSIAVRYLRSLQPRARFELARWEERARRIPDATLRRQAVATLRGERSNAEGAALLAVLAPPARAPELVRALVAYQVMYDYLDTITEPPVPNHAEDCAQLHRAVTEALDPAADTSDWYALHPSRRDGGYLAAQVATCRSVCATLPSYRHVARQLVQSARRSADVQVRNHSARSPEAEALRAWAVELLAFDPTLEWWEHAAGASSTLDVHTFLALAADSRTTERQVATALPYLTVLCALNTLLESLVDLNADRRTGDHSYVAYYRSGLHAADRLGFVAERALRLAAPLDNAARHVVVLKAMVSLYLSRSDAWTAGAKPATRATLSALGTGMRTLLVLQRLRRGVPLNFNS